MKIIILLLLLGVSAFAQNVIFFGSYSAGPTATSKVCYNQGGSTTNPVTCTVYIGSTTSSFTGGETVYCWVDTNNSATGNSWTVSDNGSSGGNTYTANGSLQHGSNSGANSQYWYTTASKTATTITVTYSGTVSFTTVFCGSYTGGSGAPDGSVGFSDTAGASSLTVSVSPTRSNDLVSCAGQMYSSGPTITLDSHYTALSDTIGPPINVVQGYRKLSASGSTSATDTLSSNTTKSMMICAAWQ